MDQFIKEKFEKFYSQKWSGDRNSFAYDDIIFELENNKYKHLYVQRAYEIFEAGFEQAKEIFYHQG